MRDLLELTILFFKIGLFTFGGGYAMLPLLQSEVVHKRGFLSEEELLDLYSIGQCTPGVIAVNVATFIGYRQKGIWGAIFSTLGIILPSLLIIIMIATVLNKFMHERYVAYAFAGIRICVVALITDIVYGHWKKNIKGYQSLAIFACALLLLVGLNFSAVWIVLVAAAAALICEEFRRRKQ